MTMADDHLLELLEELKINIQKKDLVLNNFSVFHTENNGIIFQFKFTGEPKLHTREHGTMPYPTTIQ